LAPPDKACGDHVPRGGLPWEGSHRRGYRGFGSGVNGKPPALPWSRARVATRGQHMRLAFPRGSQ